MRKLCSMNKVLAALTIIVALAGLQGATPARAQTTIAGLTVASCGAQSFPASQFYPLEMLQNGNLCTNATGGGGGSVTITAPLGTQTVAASVATTLNGGSSNASSGVATSTTNTPVVSYIFGYNGSTWDQLRSTGSPNFGLVIDDAASSNQLHTDLTSPPALSITGPSTAAWTGEAPSGTLAASPIAADTSLVNIPTGATTSRAITGDPCWNNFANTVAGSINLTASGVVITHSSTKKTYICHIHIVLSANENVALVEGTGSTCGTNTFGLAGGTTAATGWNFTSNGIALGNGGGTLYSGVQEGDTHAAGADICLLASSSSQISGTITVVQQ